MKSDEPRVTSPAPERDQVLPFIPRHLVAPREGEQLVTDAAPVLQPTLEPEPI